MDSLKPKLPYAQSLPSYKNPPVNEVVCGMRFHTPSKLNIAHIGLIWNRLHKEYPNVQHAEPIASAKGEIPIDGATGLPLPRVWFINASDDQLVQFQFDRFYFNWRRRQGDYPRYPNVIINFAKAFDTIQNFFKEFELGDLTPIECELSYINHMPKGEGWDSIEDLSNIFSDFVWRQTAGRFLPSPSKAVWRAEFPFEDKGHLNVNLKQAVRAEDRVPLFIFELTARSGSELKSREEVFKWFDIAHAWIVQGFTDLTTPEIHKVWGKEENA